MRHGLFSRAKLRWTNAVQVPPWLPPMNFDGNFPQSEIPAFHKNSSPVPCPMFLPPPFDQARKTAPSGEVEPAPRAGK